MLEGEPPYMDLPSAKALFLIITKGMYIPSFFFKKIQFKKIKTQKIGLPPLKHPNPLSSQMLDFLELTLKMDPAERPDAMALLQHPLLFEACSAAEFGAFIAKLKGQGKQNAEGCVLC